jgi:hypothetical protein
VKNLQLILVLISSFSFLFYVAAYFTNPFMKAEFKRFGLQKFGLLTIVLELLGAAGLLVGLWVPAVLLLSSGGLALLMFLGVWVRIKMKDGLLASLPALIYMLLNAYLFYYSISRGFGSY